MHETNVAGFDLNLLIAFDALFNERHLTRAARRIGLSQSAMSHALRRLRSALGDPLFVRTPRGLVPTARAEAVAPVAARVLADIGAALAPPRALDPETLRRTFVVATTDYVEIVLLPSLLARLREEAPHVVVRVRPTILAPDEDLGERAHDLIIAGASAPAMYSQKLFTDDFVTVARRGHPVVKGALTLEQFVAVDHVQISLRGTPGGPVDDALEQRGLRRRIALFVPHFLAAPMIVAKSDLLLTLARRLAQRLAPLLDLRVLEPPLAIPGVTFHQFWHERQQADPAQVWFRRLIADVGRTV